MKCFFQLIDMRDGVRSDAVGCTLEEYAIACANCPPEHLEHQLVLVLVEDVSAKADWSFSRAPVVKLTTFLERYLPSKEVVNHE